MGSILSRLRGASADRASIDEYLAWVTYNGVQVPLYGTSMQGSKAVEIENNFAGYVQQVHKRSGVVAAAVTARSLLISQLRFKWRALADHEDGRLFGNAALHLLERPAPDMTRPTLLSIIEGHSSYAGNGYVHRTERDYLRVMNPQWVDVAIGSNTDPNEPGWQLDAEVLGYFYHPGGRHGRKPQFLGREEVAHWMPEPDPVNWWRGASWITSVLREVQTDGQATDHLSKFYENAGTPQLVFTLNEKATAQQAKEYAEVVNSKTAGTENAYKNLVIGGGADVTVVGSLLAQLNQRDSQGGAESRIASRSRVPAVILGIREGMQGSALNSGNYQQTRRLWSDTWFTPYSESLCAAFENLLVVPGGAELYYDPKRIAFLQEDRKDESEIREKDAQTIRQLYDAGFLPDSIVDAVHRGDLKLLKHSGRPSVQTTDPGGATSEEGATA